MDAIHEIAKAADFAIVFPQGCNEFRPTEVTEVWVCGQQLAFPKGTPAFAQLVKFAHNHRLDNVSRHYGLPHYRVLTFSK